MTRRALCGISGWRRVQPGRGAETSWLLRIPHLSLELTPSSHNQAGDPYARRQADLEVAVTANPLPLTVDGFIDSAREFASEALDAYIARRFRRVALDAGTALEHLGKACLVSRSPALLTELRNESNFVSLLGLLGMTSGTGSTYLRTVTLRDALARVRKIVTSTASVAALEMLVDMRDGTVHAAQNDELEERLVVTFVQHCDVLLEDLGADRNEFWGRQLTVVDALLADASDKVAHHVEVKLAAARARF